LRRVLAGRPLGPFLFEDRGEQLYVRRGERLDQWLRPVTFPAVPPPLDWAPLLRLGSLHWEFRLADTGLLEVDLAF
jgi:hypothetical protein